jgi:hypothetical protein
LLESPGSALGTALPSEGRFCPKHTQSYLLTIDVVSEPGAALWQLFGAPNEDLQSLFAIGGAGDSYVGKRVRKVTERDKAVDAAVMAFAHETLQTAEDMQQPFEAQGGVCYLALAAGEPSVRSLDLEIVDQRGNVVAQALDQGDMGQARACARVSGRYVVRARVFKGYGDVGLQVFATGR